MLSVHSYTALSVVSNNALTVLMDVLQLAFNLTFIHFIHLPCLVGKMCPPTETWMCMCHSLNVPRHHCAGVPFNWRHAGAATAGLQQQACCVILCTLLGRAPVVRPTHLL